ncbi:glutamate synthase large subunit [Ligilactobacillus salitolerans]|uniref:Glutamate synthase large subunit n=1 Tax=Ligilactobacillus salitolerans TaxID=1808352 RepID=A0A401ITD6_9LACO|nr:glutamate synthase large subunit [Ligilactobacillus salitolerans]GBG94779.1 glutamate synthase large subunit [Ligilactobacillus salitolerans]
MRKTKNLLYDPRYEHDACGMGFIAHIDGRQDHELIEQALTMLERMNHRGGTGSEPDSGDGAGVLLQLPDTFFRQEADRLGFHLPQAGDYAVAQLFLPQENSNKETMLASVRHEITGFGLKVLGQRDVPFVYDACGPTARASMPGFAQVFIERPVESAAGREFENLLYRLRRHLEGTYQSDNFSISSLSAQTIVYKGMLHAYQVALFYPDLSDPAVKSAIALVHSRFSTNTFPSWKRAQPYRFLAHNGEINTLKGNENWMKSHGIELYDPEDSDSAKLENCMEFLYRKGRDIPEDLLMLIQETQTNHHLSAKRLAFDEYHASFVTPWDGPAALCFTDGIQVGAFLDRNGLRPSHYTVDDQQTIVAASESGVVDIAPESVRLKGVLGPNDMLLVDTALGKLMLTDEIKEKYAQAHPYQEWLEEEQLTLEELPQPDVHEDLSQAALETLWRRHGYTDDIIREAILPMAQKGEDPIISMGFDSPLAVLSEKSQSLFTYFKEEFAQVTNPPIDAIREEHVINTQVYLGKDADVSQAVPENARKVKLDSPFLTTPEFAKLKHLNLPGFKTATLSLAYDKDTLANGRLEKALARMFKQAEEAIDDGASLLILTDRDVTANSLLIPVLLAVGGLNNYLINKNIRSQATLIVDTGEACEIHHYAALLGYGASAIHPYGAYATIVSFGMEEQLPTYLHACVKGIVKVMSRMGISTINGYQSAQLFEAVGLDQALCDQYFTGTPSRIGGIGLNEIEAEYLERYQSAYGPSAKDALPSGGSFKFRADGEKHIFEPLTIFKFQQAVRTGDYQLFQEYVQEVNDQEEKHPKNLRAMWDLKGHHEALPLSEVEPAEAIIQRFKAGAMSFGALSQEAHETIAQAMNELGAKSNSGEGGEAAERYSRPTNSAIKQVASGRFGVNAEYLMSASEIQIKMAQGAKPGEGGQLAANKNYPWIAECRGATPGVRLISPPPHHDIYSIEDLKQLIYDLHAVNPAAKITVKLVASSGVGTIAAGVVKAGADKVAICGYDGGTGAAPRTSVRDAGLPWEIGLADAHQTLSLNHLRQRTTLETDGKLMTGRDIAVAALLGAEEFSFGSLTLCAVGCIMMRVCSLNTCPVGICTQDPRLRRHFAGKPEHVKNMMKFLAEDLRSVMAELGYHSLDQMVGHTEDLKPRFVAKGKARSLNYDQILNSQFTIERKYHGRKQDNVAANELDAFAQSALEAGQPVKVDLPIDNTQRAVGSRIGGWIAQRFGDHGLAAGKISFNYQGVAGQSFGAFIPQGLALKLQGEANDYVGKGLCGGRLVIASPDNAREMYSQATIVGNVACFGATSGEAYFNGRAGERFCVRNSGADVVVEGIGDHGCEYMTDGHVVVLGQTGRNFGAGMSGGLAYVYDPEHIFESRVNEEMVSLYTLKEQKDLEIVVDLLQKHVEFTGSLKASQILANWKQASRDFVKVYPNDYHKINSTVKELRAQGVKQDQLLEEAFEQVVANDK